MNTPYRSNPLHHIAVCIDQSEASRQALAYARALRALAPGRLSVVHVAQWPLGDVAGGGVWERAWLERQVSSESGEEPVFLTEDLCAWAESDAVDLLIAAPHSGRLERALLGSFAGYLTRHARCPVLIAHPTQGRARGDDRVVTPEDDATRA